MSKLIMLINREMGTRRFQRTPEDTTPKREPQKENSCLNTCVLLRSENIDKTTDPLLSLALLRDEQRLSLGEFVDGS